MASNYTKYPSGFRVLVSTDGVSVSEPDMQIKALHDAVNTNGSLINNFQFISEVLICAKRLIPSLTDFIRINQNNPDMSNNGYDILRDTVTYLETGRRPISLYTYIAASSFEESGATYRTDRKEITLTIPPRKYLTYWAKQPGGVLDILCTLNFIFGTKPHE